MLSNALRRACRRVQLCSQCLQMVDVLQMGHFSHFSLIHVIGESHGATAMKHEWRKTGDSTYSRSPYEQDVGKRLINVKVESEQQDSKRSTKPPMESLDGIAPGVVRVAHNGSVNTQKLVQFHEYL